MTALRRRSWSSTTAAATCTPRCARWSGSGPTVSLTGDHGAALGADGLFVPGVGNFHACMRGLRAGGRGAGHRRAARRRAAGPRGLRRDAGPLRRLDRAVDRTARGGPRRVAGHGRAAARRGRPAHGLVDRERRRRQPAVRRRRGPAVLLRALVCGAATGSLYPEGTFAAVAPVVTWATHGTDFVAAVENGPLCATQFHPEKSGDAGRPAAGELGEVAVSGSRLELLPAVDIADGRAVQLVQGVAGTGGEFGDPLDAALAWQEQGAEWLHLVDLDAAFGRGSNRELVDAIVGAARHPGRAVRRDPRRRVPRCRARDRLPAGQPRYGGSRAARVDRRGHRRARRPDRGRPRRARDHARGPRVDPRRRRPVGDAGAARPARAAPATSSPTSTRTACSPARTSPCSSRCAQRTARPVVASGGVSTLDDIQALRALVDAGVEGAIIGSALYRGAFTLPEALDVAGRP